ncbi:GIGYF family protein Gyf isoform X3 [Onthophagus taurus]|uniref:GIGYF family protein Gyf isoform X3 n=1 Tax=Onthophagus taurus TaxID=166361 RepID=UPI000C2016E9|nr:GIGYF family protein CG11148 isoform X3 [Onthophagus taurus]
MTDSMNFGPEWLRNLSSDGSTTGGTGGGARYQLSGYRYGREEMLGLYEKGFKPPASLVNFTRLYTDPPLVPLVLLDKGPTEEERLWQSRAPPINSSTRGSRGSSLERGGTRPNRGRGSYQYGRNVNSYDATGGVGGWGNGEQQEWSPRKDFGGYRSASVDNWRRNRPADEEEGWRSTTNRGSAEKWVRSTSWRDGDKEDDRGGPHERSRSWFDGRNHVQRKGWDEDHQPEWFTEQLGEGGGTFDATGAYHGSDDEQDHRIGGRKELQKSTSQQNISPRQPAPLTSSKSSVSLSKQCEIEVKEEHINVGIKDVEETKEKLDPPEKPIEEKKPKNVEIKKEVKVDKIEKQMGHKIEGNLNVNGIVVELPSSSHRVEEDFDRLQEDLVSKLVVEEENPKTTMNPNMGMSSVGVTPQPPPNLVPPIQDKWFYRDPQGDLQGPFVSTEMAEWFKAGYFTLSLLVRRQCDKTFYTLGDLVRLCNGANPFLSTTRIPPLKEVPPVKLTDQDHLLNLHNLQVQFALSQGRPYKSVPPTDWANLTALQQRDMLTQHLMPQAQMTPVELQYFQQSAQPPPQAANPLMHIINQMQQVNKLSGPPMTEQPNAIPMQLDPLQALVQQMHSLQRIPQGATPLPGMGLPQTIPSENLINNMTGIHGNLPGPGMTGIPSSLPGSGVMPNIPQKPLENLATPADDNPINNLLRQLQNKNISQPQPMDALWQQNQYITSQIQQTNQWQQQQQQQTVQSNQPPQQPQPIQSQQQHPPPPPPSQQQPPNEKPISMWDLTPTQSQMNTQPVETTTNISEEIQQHSPSSKEKEQSKREKESAKEEKKRKEQEEKQLKKEAEEKRKQEQRKQEMEKKIAEEKKKKEEERIRKELEKARKEAEEKRLRELEEKRKLKEARKAEEEARKRAEEQKKLEDEHEKEKIKEEKMKEEAKRAMVKAIQENQNKNNNVVSKAAPWSNPSSASTGPSLLAIQKAEREKRVEMAYLQQQQRQLLMQEQQTIEKASIQLNWANKPIQPRQVKSLAEIQAEEQELLAKQAAERLAQQNKEKENQTAPVSTGIWQGQNLTWANTASQWPSNVAGFWDDVPTQKAPSKPSNVVKSNSTSAMVTQAKPQQQPQQQQQPKVAKAKTKKEETTGSKNNGSLSTNGPATEEFTQWCIKALSNVTSTVDIPTFIGFLKDIESAADVKDYCREYLGESQAMHQFTAQFLEKRRSFRPKTNAHKDDMCSPAPAITPSMQHNSDFQEVKGKGKKTKKSKMTKVDARILGFNVTAAQDRINVGDRDYGDN